MSLHNVRSRFAAPFFDGFGFPIRVWVKYIAPAFWTFAGVREVLDGMLLVL